MENGAIQGLSAGASSALPTGFAALCVLLGLCLPFTAIATNGLNQIGFGAESIAMGGADIAVARDTSALNTNPAGLTQINGKRADVNMAVGYAGAIKHKDQYGNDVSNSNKFPVLGSMGNAWHIADSPLTVGVGLFAQGGSGAQFDNLNTAFGTRDDLSIQFRVARITPGFAWQVTDRLSIGASLIGTYSDLKQEVFPDTSFADPASPSDSFFGFELLDMTDFSLGGKLGLMYKPTDRLTLGAAFNNKVDIDLQGRMQLNLSALGLDTVTYRDAKAKNIDQPREFGVGAAFQSTDKLLLSLELNWINWSNAVTTGVVTARNPDNPAAPSSIENKIENDWRDQYVVAVGAAYQLSDRTMIRAGYNYGRNPIPSENLNPLINTIAEHHLTLGIGHRLSEGWRIDGALEWDMRNEVTYTNPSLPFGQDAETIGELVAVHFRVSRIW